MPGTFFKKGVGLFPDELTPDEDRLTRENITRILELETRGLVPSVIQELVWKTLFPADRQIDGVRTIDFQTTADPAEQVHARFGGGATVDYARNGRKFMRLDGILNSTADFSREITELISHFQNDHVSYAALETLLLTGNFAGLFAPNAVLDASKNAAFGLLKEKASDMGYDPGPEDSMLLLTSLFGSPSSSRTGSIGGFYFTTLYYRGKIRVDIFKYKSPKNVNTDGAIYQITHGNTGFLLFGDFDDPAGIRNLLDASGENWKRRNGLREEQAALFKRLYEHRDELAVLDAVYADMRPWDMEEAASDGEALFRTAVLEKRIAELEEAIGGLEMRIAELQNEAVSLPVLKADVVKWPHHAHVFKEKDRDVIIKLNEAVNLSYFIYQVHSAQDLDKFETFIKDFDFKDKFVNSGEQPVKFISMEWFRTRLGSLFAARQREAS